MRRTKKGRSEKSVVFVTDVPEVTKMPNGLRMDSDGIAILIGQLKTE